MKLDSWLRWGIVIGVLAVFFTPTVVATPLFFPFITGKNFAFRILVEIVFTLWLILALRDPKIRPRASLLFFALTAFVAVIGIADIFGANPHKSFWSNFERMEGWIGLIHLYAFFVVLWSTFREAKWWKMLFETSVAVSIAVGVYGVFQLAHVFTINQGGSRVDGTFGNATYLAVYMLFNLFIAGLLFLHHRNEYFRTGEKAVGVLGVIGTTLWLIASLPPDTPLPPLGWFIFILFFTLGIGSLFVKRQWFYGLAIALQFVMIFYAGTRGTILGLIGGILVASAIFIFFGKTAPKLKKVGIAVIIALVVIAGGFYAIRNTSFVQNHGVFSRITSISISDGATRFAIWNMALKGVAERPLLGWGQENFNYIFNKHYAPSMYAQESWFDRAHNQYLDWLVAGGVFGFALWLSFFGFALWYLWRPKSSFQIVERGILTGLLAAYAFHDLFVFDNLVSYIFFFTILAYIAHRREEVVDTATSNEKSKNALTTLWGKSVPSGLFAFGAPVIVGGMVAVFYFANVPGLATGSNLIEALKPHTAGLGENVRYLKSAGETTGLGRQEVREQIVQFALQARNSSIGDTAFRDGATTYALQKMSEEIALNPQDARLRVFLGSFFQQIGKNDDALRELEVALTLSPKKQQILFQLGSLQISRGDMNTGLDLFRQAYELEPAYDTARTLYASALIRSGNIQLARSLLMERFGTATPDDDNILQAYFDVRDYANGLLIAKTRADKAPKDVKARVQLAAAYMQAGDRLNAIQALQDAIAIDATFKAQGEYYIQEIAAGRTP